MCPAVGQGALAIETRDERRGDGTRVAPLEITWRRARR